MGGGGVVGLVYMGSGRSHPPHIHMLSNLAYLSLAAAADRLRGDAQLLNACRCSRAQKDSDALVGGREGGRGKKKSPIQ